MGQANLRDGQPPRPGCTHHMLPRQYEGSMKGRLSLVGTRFGVLAWEEPALGCGAAGMGLLPTAQRPWG